MPRAHLVLEIFVILNAAVAFGIVFAQQVGWL